jgi:hypothetical protein
MYGRKNSKEFGQVMLADSGRPSTVTCEAVSRGSQSNNRDRSATDMDQSWKDVEDWTGIQPKVLQSGLNISEGL